MLSINTVKACDIMQTKVVTLSPSTPIQSAIETFEELHISGAPVVDERGKIVGMLTAMDIAKAEHMGDDMIQADRGEYRMLSEDEEDDEAQPQSFDEVILSLNDFSPATHGRTTVSEWMSNGIVSVSPESSLHSICRLMIKEHIHRVPVVKNGKLAGIISTLDIVRCIASAGVDSTKSAVKAAATRARATKSNRD